MPESTVNTPPGCINAVVCISLRYRFLSPNRESTLIKDQNNNPKTTNLMIPFRRALYLG